VGVTILEEYAASIFRVEMKMEAAYPFITAVTQYLTRNSLQLQS
jgi:hypothetical protein